MSSLPPFLPPTDAEEAAARAPKPASKKSVFLWVALIVMFIAIYNVFSTAPPAKTLPPCAPSSSWSSGSGWTWLTVVIPFAICGLFLTWLFRLGRQSSRYAREQEPATLALVEGRYRDAAAAFDVLAAKYSRHGGRLVAEWQRGLALLRSSDLDGALRSAIESEKGALIFGRESRIAGAVLLAELYALRGEYELAQRWLDESRARLAKVGDRIHSAAQLRIAEAILWCRTNRSEDALASLERDQRCLDSVATGPALAESWLLRAFAIQQNSDARDAGRIEPWLTLLRTRPRGSLDYLASAWPELRTFLVTQELAAA